MIAAVELVWPDLLPYEWLSFGRIRPIHTASVLFGWLSIGLTGIAYLVVYRTARRALFSVALAEIGLGLLNLALVAGLVTLTIGMTRGPVEYREWMTPIAAVFAAGSLLNGFNILVTLVQRHSDELYIADWFILGAFVWLPILYVIGYLPQFDRGIGNVVIQGYYMHVVLGLWFTPLVLGITYWSLPRMLAKPIYSYALGVLAFWANLVFYPLIGAHHFVFSPLPWWLQTTAIATGIGMMIPVVASSGNFLLTMNGSWRMIRREPAVWFIAVGAVCYLLVSLQGSLQSFRSANALLHFTNHTVGHAHFAVYGFVSFLLFGAIYGLVPRITGALDAAPSRAAAFLARARRHGALRRRDDRGRRAAGPHLDGRPAVHRLRHRQQALVHAPRRRRRPDDARPCRVRLEPVADAPAAAPADVRRARTRTPAGAGAMIDLNALFHRSPVAIVAIGAAVFGVLSFLVALRPAIELDASTPLSLRAPNVAVARGRALYLAEGCGYCHSQLVRPIFVDAAYGRPSEITDYADAAPPLAGTERTGPDLANVGVRQPSVMWNLLHLFNPRSMVPDSVMPGFPWYFEIIDRARAPTGPNAFVLAPGEPFLPRGKVALPHREALDLVAYLQTLKQE